MEVRRLLISLFSCWLPLLTAAQVAPAATSGSGYLIIALQGRVLHPQGRTFMLSDNYGNVILNTQLELDGRFHFRARWGATQPATLRIGAEETALWITPGDNLIVTLDARRFDETIHYTGHGARVNNYLAAEFLESEYRTRDYNTTLTGTEPHFRAWLAADKRRTLARLAAAFPHPTLSEQMFISYQKHERYFLLCQQMERSWPSDHITRPGLMAPALQAITQQGAPVTLASLRGKVIYVDFWASWCGFCRFETPYARKLQAALSDHASEVVFLNVSTDLSRDKWQCALEEEHLDGLNAWSPDSTKHSAWEAYLLASLPRYVLIGRDGRIIQGNVPRPSSGAVEGLIRKALGRPKQVSRVRTPSSK